MQNTKNEQTESPLVSVVVPVYNAEPYLDEAISSILDQTHKNLELVLVNDGSTDLSLDVCNKWLKVDNRVKVISLSNKSGISNALNAGIALSNSKYIARMDADDISLPNRLEKQIRYMEANPDIGVCGSKVKTFGDFPSSIWEVPENDEAIRVDLFFGTPFCHPTVILRRELLLTNNISYESQFDGTEDKRIWVRLAEVTKFSNLPEILLLYRTHAKQATRLHRREDVTKFVPIYKTLLQSLGLSPNDDELIFHVHLIHFDHECNEDYICRVQSWLLKLHEANERKRAYTGSVFAEKLAYRWFRACYSTTSLGLSIWHLYSSSPLRQFEHVHFSKRIKLFGRCLLQYPKHS